MTVVPATRITAAPTASAIFIFVQAISFNAPLLRVKVDPPAAAPLVMATDVTIFANDTGAACTECADIAPAMIAVVEETPRLAKNFRSFSTTRPTRILAASSPTPKAAPTSLKFRPSKNRSTTASWSF